MIERCYLVGPPVVDPAQEIGGLSILLRTLLSLQDAGVREVVLVDAPGLAGPAPARLTVAVRTDDGARRGPALVVRAGLVFHPGLGRRLARAEVAPGDVLAVGEAGAGLAAAGADAVAAAVTAMRDGALAPLAAPAAGEFVLAPRDAAGRAAAERRLLGTCIKPADGLVSRYLNRPVSLRITRLLLRTSITPNHMTAFAAVFGAAGVAVTLTGGTRGLAAGALLLHGQSVLDGCDGEIARLKHLRSRRGEWMDQLADDFVNLGFMTAVGWNLYRGGWALAGPLTWIAAIAHVVYQAVLYAALITKAGGSGNVATLRWHGRQGTRPRPARSSLAGRGWQRFRDAVEQAAKRDFFLFAYLPCAAFGVAAGAFVWNAGLNVVFATGGLLHWLFAGGPEAEPPS